MLERERKRKGAGPERGKRKGGIGEKDHRINLCLLPKKSGLRI